MKGKRDELLPYWIDLTLNYDKKERIKLIVDGIGYCKSLQLIQEIRYRFHFDKYKFNWFCKWIRDVICIFNY